MSAIMKHDMKAILGEDFFKEEVRENYLISDTGIYHGMMPGIRSALPL